MTTSRLLVLEPDPSDPPGRLGEWLEAAGVDLEMRRPLTDPLPDSLAGYAGVVCLGGGMGVHDVTTYPWLMPLQRLLARASSGGVPTLAICLGAQLLAAANGGRVAAGGAPEAGPALVSKRDAAWQDPLLADVPLLPDVLQFHRDSIEQLPAGAQVLASGAEFAHQAFRIGSCAYGFQFHIETTPETVHSWVEQSPELAAWGRQGAFDADRLAELHRDLADVWQPVATKFAGVVRGEIEPAGLRSRALPLE